MSALLRLRDRHPVIGWLVGAVITAAAVLLLGWMIALFSG